MSFSRSLLFAGRRLALQSTRSLLTSSSQKFSVLRESRRPLVAQFSTKTKGDEELSSFLKDEIEAEKKGRKQAVPPKIEGFDVKMENSEVTLTRQFQDETVKVEFNVNHSVDAEDNMQANEQETGAMLSKPNFDVIIEKAGQKLLLSCTFSVEQPDQQQEFDDLFQIVEFAMFTGEEAQDSDYSVSGDIMDAQLYDLLMNLLEERGVTNEFADQLIEFSTSYEHGQYINLLEKLRHFVSK